MVVSGNKWVSVFYPCVCVDMGLMFKNVSLGNPRRHITACQKLKDKPCQGEPSLQNSLELAIQVLR